MKWAFVSESHAKSTVEHFSLLRLQAIDPHLYTCKKNVSFLNFWAQRAAAKDSILCLMRGRIWF